MKHLIVIRKMKASGREYWVRLSNGVVTCWIPASLLQETGIITTCYVLADGAESYLTTQSDTNETNTDNQDSETFSSQDDKERFI